MNLKSVRTFHNFQRQLSLKKVSPTLHNSPQEDESTNNNLTINEMNNTATNNFLIMFESEVKRHWGI